MKILSMLTLAAALATVPACGKKAKPAENPVTTDDGSGDRSSGQGDVTKTDTSGGDTANPASLGELIYFEFDSSALSDEAKATLQENAEWLKEDPARTLRIEGHTDEVGTEEYNLGLGERRAAAARDYLVALGIDVKRVHILTKGELEPASAEDAKNRRSVFISTKK